jgi:protein-S-isoprenylcysteine O-methyltransferase Ste14
VLQLLLGATIIGSGFVGVYWPGSADSFLAILGLLIAVAGVLLVALGLLSLGSSFTPLPRPRTRTRLRESGIFRLVRHPVYGGTILIGLGWSLADAPLGLIPTALLALLFDLKARREEAWLLERFPAYSALPGRHAPPVRALALLSLASSSPCNAVAERQVRIPSGEYFRG